MYSLHESLARERLNDQLEQAAGRRLAHQAASVRKWQRLAAYCDRRVASSQRQLADGAADYQLVA